MKKTAIILLLSFLCGPVLAQNYEIEYESPPGFRPALDIDPFTAERLDFNGDGAAELILLQVDEQDNPITVDVIDIATGTSLWTFDVQELVLAGFRFKGFFDIDDDDVREPTFFSKDSSIYRIIDPQTNESELDVTGVAFATVADIDNDGRHELIVANRDTRTVQVYGSGDVGTTVEDGITTALYHLTQNYPNPFNPTTEINYQIPISSNIRLTIYNLQGQLIRVLIDEDKPVGYHNIIWDGTDDRGKQVASGIYLYMLKAGSVTIKKKLTLMK